MLFRHCYLRLMISPKGQNKKRNRICPSPSICKMCLCLETSPNLIPLPLHQRTNQKQPKETSHHFATAFHSNDLVILVIQWCIPSVTVRYASRPRTGLRTADNARQPARDATLCLTRLVLRASVDKVDIGRVDVQAREVVLRGQQRAAANVERGNRGARARESLVVLWTHRGRAHGGWGADGRRRVAKEGVHVLEADTARLGVDEID